MWVILVVLSQFRVMKVFGRFHRFPAQSLSVSGSFSVIYRFPAQSLSVSGSFSVICIEKMLHSTYNSTFDQCNNIV